MADSSAAKSQRNSSSARPVTRTAGPRMLSTTAFLLPAPPTTPRPAVAFRTPPGSEPRELNPVERRYLREAARLQWFLSWLAKQLDERRVALQHERIESDPARAAARVRERLGVTL